MTLGQLIKAGGLTLFVLFACSIISIAIILERYIYYRLRSKIKRSIFMNQIREQLAKQNFKKTLELCNENDTPFSSVVAAGLSLHGQDEKVILNTMERQVVVETALLEKHTAIVGTVGSIAVYIGLFGTVLGIIKAFHDISTMGTGGMDVVIDGIAEALVCTAAGLAVSVPAVIAYNYFMTRIGHFIKDMELSSSETMDLLTVKKNEYETANAKAHR